MAKEGRAHALSLRLVLLASGFVILHGCGPGSPPMLPTWIAQDKAYTPEDGTSNAFDSYALIAKDVEDTIPTQLVDRVFFDRIYEDKVLEKIEKPLSRLCAATKKKCEFRYSAAPMFGAPPYQRGWRLLGRALCWKIERACVTGAFDQAIDYSVAATKFGFDLTGGAATDASLGFEIADEARRAIAPFLAKFGAAQLGVLADGLAHALEGKPSLKTAIDHEHGRMLQGVQYIQDAYANGRFDELMSKMREDVRDAVAYLKGLKSQDAKKRPAYFQGFAEDAEKETQWLSLVADLPAIQRKTEKGPSFTGERPWKTFAKHFFTAAEPLLKIQDSSVARTRLAILTCELLKSVKTSQVAPKDLSGFSNDLTLDPYTGRPFAYRASGPIFQVYSLDEDGIDNAGDSDENFSTPDLRLEAK